MGRGGEEVLFVRFAGGGRERRRFSPLPRHRAPNACSSYLLHRHFQRLLLCRLIWVDFGLHILRGAHEKPRSPTKPLPRGRESWRVGPGEC